MRSIFELKERSSESEIEGDNSIEFNRNNNILTITIECPWEGDSDTGFGRDLSIDISKQQVVLLIAYLSQNFLEQQ